MGKVFSLIKKWFLNFGAKKQKKDFIFPAPLKHAMCPNMKNNNSIQ